MKRPRMRHKGQGGGAGGRRAGWRDAGGRRGGSIDAQDISTGARTPLLSALGAQPVAPRTALLGPQTGTVDAKKCNACGACEEVCPIGAISVAEVAEIDANRCAGCGLCVTACPFDALALSPARPSV